MTEQDRLTSQEWQIRCVWAPVRRQSYIKLSFSKKRSVWQAEKKTEEKSSLCFTAYNKKQTNKQKTLWPCNISGVKANGGLDWSRVGNFLPLRLVVQTSAVCVNFKFGQDWKKLVRAGCLNPRLWYVKVCHCCRWCCICVIDFSIEVNTKTTSLSYYSPNREVRTRHTDDGKFGDSQCVS